MRHPFPVRLPAAPAAGLRRRWQSTLSALGRPRLADPDVVSGPVRLDRRTKRLVSRVRPGEIALIDHVDLDRVSAEALLMAQVAAVLNAKPSISGRYPNLGPELLVAAGVPLLDDLGGDIFQHVRDGDVVRVDGNTVFIGAEPVAHGVRQDTETVAKAMTDAREGLSVQLEAFATNTVEYLRHDRDLLLDGVGVPAVATRIAGRPCVVVVRGYGYRDDLRTLRPYLRDARPVLIGVDGGADALVEAGLRPDLIVGDMDSVSDATLRCGAELVLHTAPDGRAPGAERLRRLNLPAVTFPAAATSEDVALLLADAHGAELLVAVGGQASIGEFLDRGRGGMASTFLTRLKVGGRLVDAQGVSRLYRPTQSVAGAVLLAAACVAAMTAAVLLATVWYGAVDDAGRWWDALMVRLQRAIS